MNKRWPVSRFVALVENTIPSPVAPGTEPFNPYGGHFTSEDTVDEIEFPGPNDDTLVAENVTLAVDDEAAIGHDATVGHYGVRGADVLKKKAVGILDVEKIWSCNQNKYLPVTQELVDWLDGFVADNDFYEGESSWHGKWQ